MNYTFQFKKSLPDDKPKSPYMGRLGDADVHQAFVEFRAKESDKCLSAQCIYCQAIKAKNTSRQRAHLLECAPYLIAMKERNPNSSLLELAAAQGTPTPAPKQQQQQQHQQLQQQPPATGASASKKRDHAALESPVVAPAFQGDSVGAPGYLIPQPKLERDFQMAIQLNPKISVGPTIWGERNWISFISGHWNGRWGKGTVVPGGQDRQFVALDLSTHVEATYLLQTHDQPTAFITVRTEGWRVGPRDVLERLQDPGQADVVDPKLYSFRLYIHMETGDSRYLHLNTGMWIGSGMRRGTEVIYDAYRVS